MVIRSCYFHIPTNSTTQSFKWRFWTGAMRLSDWVKEKKKTEVTHGSLDRKEIEYE